MEFSEKLKKIIYLGAFFLASFVITSGVQAAGLAVGNETLTLQEHENLYYGITSPTNASGTFLLFEKGPGNTIFRIDHSGNITSTGNLVGANNYWNLSGSNLYASTTDWNLGIGTNNPGAKLGVGGDINLISGYFRNSIGGSSGANLIPISADAWRSRTDFWTPNTWTSGTASISIVDPPAGAIVPSGKTHQFTTSAGRGYVIDQFIQIDPNITYYGKIWAARISGSGVLYVGYAAYDKDGNALTGNGGTRGYFIANGASPAAAGTWYYSKIKGEGTLINQFPVGTRYIKPLILVNNSSGGVTQVAGFEISDRPFEQNNNIFDFATNGSSRLYVDSTGNLGIGTTGPATPFDVLGKIKINTTGTIYNQDALRWLDMSGVLGDSLKVSADLYSTAGELKTDGTGINYMMGSLSIGTTQSSQKLHVQGGIATIGGDAATLFTSYNASAVGSPQQFHIKHNYGVVEIRNERGSIGFTAGNVGIGTSSPEVKLDVIGGNLRVGSAGAGQSLTVNGNSGTTATIFLNSASKSYGIYQVGTQDNYLQGDLGIGAVSPSATLDVTGSLKVSSAVTFSGSLYAGGGSRLIMVDNTGNLSATTTAAVLPPGSVTLPTGSNGQTLRYNNGSWVANSTIYNNGTNVGIGTANPGANFDVSGRTIKLSNFYPEYRWKFGGATDLDWKKIADITIGTGLYTGASFEVNVLQNVGNYGSTVQHNPMKFYVRATRSGSSQDSANDGQVSGPVNDYVRLVKVGTGIYELQVRQIGDFRHMEVTARAMSINSLGSGGSINYINTPANGSTSGTIYTATPIHYEYFSNAYFAGNVGIGTTSPAVALDVYSKVKITSGGIIYNSDNSRWFDMTGTLSDSLKVSGNIVASGKNHSLGVSANWDEVGVGKQTALKFQGHDQFWIGAGNGTWYTGAPTTNNHDLLITTMTSPSPYVRGITFAAATNGSYNSGYRLGKWYSETSSATSHLNVDGGLNVAGNVGIGLSNPVNAKLQVVGDIATNNGGKISPVATDIGAANITYNTTITDARFQFNGYYGHRFDTAGGTRMVINQAGNVGIGTTNPLDTLHVNGNVRVGALLNCSGTGAAVKTDSSGRLVCGTVSGGVTGAGATNYLARWTSSNTIATSTIYDNGTNVGIGTTVPAEKLQVNGNIALSGVAYSSKITINPTPGVGWYRIASGNNTGGTAYVDVTIDNKTQRLEFNYNMRSYTSSNEGLGAINVLRTFSYNIGPISKIRLTGNSVAGDYNVYLDVYINSATAPTAFTIYGTNGANFLSSPIYNPADSAYAQVIDLNDIAYSGLATSRNFQVGGNSYLLGNVGIGTAPLSTALDIFGKLKITSTGRVYNELNNQWLDMTGVTENALQVNKNIITVTGKVGIGTTTPRTKLEMFDGDINLSDTDVIHGMTGFFWQNNYGSLSTYNTTAGGLLISGLSDTDSTGLAFRGVIGTETPTAATPAVSLIAQKQLTTGASVQALGATETVLSILNSSTKLVNILGNGNVGIGTTNPTNKLDIWHANSSANTNSSNYPLKIYNNSWSGSQITGIEFWNGSQKVVPVSRIISQMNGSGNGGENLYFQTQSYSTTNPNPNQPTTKMSILADGEVGIGTATPSAKLDVYGSLRVSGALNSVVMDKLSGTGNRIVMTDSSGSLYATSTTVATGLPAPSTNGSTLRSNGSAWVANTVLYNNGTNVGIGTTSPVGKLNIGETTGLVAGANQGSFVIDHENSGGASSIVFRSKSNRGSDYGFIQYQDAENIGGAGEAARLTIGTSNDTNDHLILQPSGNVGIGTASPAAALDVLGKIKINTTGTIYNQDALRWLDMSGVLGDSLKVSADLYSTAGELKTDGTGINYMMGSLGIGTATPGAKLDINNLTGDVGTRIQAYRNGTNYNNSYLTFSSPRSDSADGTTTGPRGYIVTPGDASTTGSSLFLGANTTNGVITGTPASIRSSNQSNVEISSPGYVDFWRLGINYARINGAGNSYFNGGAVGIGTASPAANSLDVYGKVKTTSGGIIYNTNSTYWLDLAGVLSPSLKLPNYLETNDNTITNRRFTMLENYSPQYIILCVNSGNNDVNGRMMIDRTSSHHQAASLDIVLTSNSGAIVGGSLVTNQYTEQNEQYKLVKITYNGVSYVAVKYEGWVYPATVGHFSGRLVTTDSSTTFTVLNASQVSNEVAVTTTNSKVTMTGNVGIGTTNPGTNSLYVVGATYITGNLDVIGNINAASSTLSINKLQVNTIDPLYKIKGINYSTFAPSIVGGVKEEVTGKIKIDKKVGSEYQAVIDFNREKVGTDLWVWYNVIDFNKDNVEAVITPYGGFAKVYYYISEKQIIFKSDVPIEASYRLLAKRFDWRDWPTRAKNQAEKPGFIIK